MSIDSGDIFIWPTNFSCVLIIGKIILPSDYNLTIGMMPGNGHESTAIGLKKIKQFINRYIQNSILIHKENEFLPELAKLKTNTIQLPLEPSDYFFANILYHKLSAITKNHFTICQITIDSSIGDRIKYQINETCDAYDYILETDGWWKHDSVETNQYDTFPSWEELDLGHTAKFSPKLVKGGKDESKSIR